MKVKELVKRLQKCNPDDIVVLSRDAEGNGYFEARVIDEVVFAPEDAEIYEHELTEELQVRGFTQEDVRQANGETYKNAVCLWP